MNSVNYISKDNNKTKLMTACFYNEYETVVELLKNPSIQVDLKNEYGYDALFYTCQNCKSDEEDSALKIVKLLISKSKKFIDKKMNKESFNFILWSFDGKSDSIIEYLISLFNEISEEYISKLFFKCVSVMKTNIIPKLLIKKGFDIDSLDEFGYTALYNSCTFENHEMTQILLDLGADPEIKCPQNSIYNDTPHTVFSKYNPVTFKLDI